jgi:Trp operon repressor
VSEETKLRIEELLLAGWKRSEIAREVGVSASTVTRWARFLGFPDLRPRPSNTDWTAVQAHYDQGHTIDECRVLFSFTFGAWDKAVSRGEITPRPRGDRQLARSTRDEVEDLLACGQSQNEVARTLGLSKSTVAYHARSLGKKADPRFARRHDWEAVQAAIDRDGLSMRKCLEKFEISRDTWYRAVRRGDLVPPPALIPLEELLVVGRRTSRSHLRHRLHDAGLKEKRCESCGLTEWLGKPIGLQLHHVNGDGLDNRLENLQVVCGNCHAQTDTWGGKNKNKRQWASLTLF